MTSRWANVVRWCSAFAFGWGMTVCAQEAPKKKKVIRLDALTVEGRIQKPQAFYILQRSNLNFDELNRAESFVKKIERTAEKPPL